MTPHISGWLALDKPLGLSSHQVLLPLKRLLRGHKIGHLGTLDPLASGVLPIAVGEATKLISLATASEKHYTFKVTWGEERETDDAEGAVLQSSASRPQRSDIEDLLPSFHGTVLQLPPLYSAIKIAGKRACDRARDGEQVTLKPRPVTIFDLHIAGMTSSDETVFSLTCGPGTYVRSVARDLGRLLNCYGYVSELRRTRVGSFDEKNAISFKKVLALTQVAEIQGYLNRFDYVLDDIPALILDTSQVARLTQGQPVEVNHLFPFEEGLVICRNQGLEAVAMARFEQGIIKPKRVFLNHLKERTL